MLAAWLRVFVLSSLRINLSLNPLRCNAKLHLSGPRDSTPKRSAGTLNSRLRNDLDWRYSLRGNVCFFLVRLSIFNIKIRRY